MCHVFIVQVFTVCCQLLVVFSPDVFSVFYLLHVCVCVCVCVCVMAVVYMCMLWAGTNIFLCVNMCLVVCMCVFSG